MPAKAAAGSGGDDSGWKLSQKSFQFIYPERGHYEIFIRVREVTTAQRIASERTVVSVLLLGLEWWLRRRVGFT